MSKERKRQRQELVDKLVRLAVESHQCSVLAEDEEYSVDVAYFDQKRPYTYVFVVVYQGDNEFSESGFTKCCWPDSYDEFYGLELACKKAISDIVKKILKG